VELPLADDEATASSDNKATSGEEVHQLFSTDIERATASIDATEHSSALQLISIIEENQLPLAGTADQLDSLHPQRGTVESEPNALAVLMRQYFHPQIVEIAALTIANCGDNIAIYLPIFASSISSKIVITLVVFYCMLIVWFTGSFLLIGYDQVSELLDSYGPICVPFCLIGLGVYILSSSILFKL